MRNRDVICKDCGKKLAHWDMFSNLQFEEEWECIGKFRQKVEDHWRTKNGKGILISSTPDLEKYPILLKSQMNYCSLIYHTKYCRKCAYKRHFKCGRPRCKGRIVKVRKSDGGNTKYTHGGW